MKLIWFSHFIPYPPKGGSHQRSYNLLRRVARNHSVHLIAFNLLNEDPARLGQYKHQLLLDCESVEFWELPFRWKSLQWWWKLGLSSFQPRPFTIEAFYSDQLRERFCQVMQRTRPDVVHFDSIDLALYIGAVRSIRCILNHHNCESAMLKRRASCHQVPLARWFLNQQAKRLQEYEAELCPNMGANLTVSLEDAILLRQSSPEAHIHIVENGTDTGYFTPQDQDFDPRTLVFAGSLNWYPNLSALKYLRESIWPCVQRAVPGAHLYIAGMKPVRWLIDWANSDSNMTLAANPEDIRPWIARGAVFVCPIRDGGGTRLKILDALAMGKAVVSTRIGCEGLRLESGKHVLMADTDQEFIDAVSRILQDSSLRRSLSRCGRDLVEREYSWDQISMQLEEAYKCDGGDACSSFSFAKPLQTRL